MKRSMRKVSGLLMLLVLVFTLTACAAQETVPNEEMYQAKADQYVEMLASMDAEFLSAQVTSLEENYEDFEQEIALYPYIGGTGSKFDFTAEAYVSMLKSYEANLEEFGAYVGLKEYEGGKETKDGISYSVVYEFEQHDMRISLEFDKDNVVQTVTVDPIYSFGEIVEKAALNTVLGMGVVFAVLILLSVIISCFKFISKIEENAGKKKAEKAKSAAAETVSAPTAAPVETAAAPETDDLELVAVITAAVAAAMGTSTDGFVVRSIKRKSNNKWKRA